MEARSRRYDDKVIATMRWYEEEPLAVARKMTCNPWSAGPVIMTLHYDIACNIDLDPDMTFRIKVSEDQSFDKRLPQLVKSLSSVRD